MNRPTLSRLALSAVVATLAAACSRSDRRSDAKVAFDQRQADAAAAEPLGPGDVRVTSTDGALVLSLVGDSVRMQLSDSLRNSVRRDIDSSAGSNAFGAMIARSVSGVVSNAMGFVVRIPVQDVENVRYEDGTIKFESRGGKRISMGGRTDERQSHASFSPADGQRFVAAVKARQAALGGR